MDQINPPAVIRSAEETEALVLEARGIGRSRSRDGWRLADIFLSLDQLGWTQTKIAKQCGYSQQWVSRVLQFVNTTEAGERGDFDESMREFYHSVVNSATSPATTAATSPATSQAKPPKPPVEKTPTIFCPTCAHAVFLTKEPKPGCNDCKAARKADKEAKAEAKAEQQAAPSELVDAYGQAVPNRCKDILCDPWMTKTVDLISTTVANLRERRLADEFAKRSKFFPFIEAKDFIDGVGFVDNYLDQLLEHLTKNRPGAVCPCCKGEGCTDCKMNGLVPDEVYKRLKA